MYFVDSYWTTSVAIYEGYCTPILLSIFPGSTGNKSPPGNNTAVCRAATMVSYGCIIPGRWCSFAPERTV
jgi:hypothetical protein